MPNLFVIAGPNGAGKSTSAPELLSGVRGYFGDPGRPPHARTPERWPASFFFPESGGCRQASGYAFHLYFFWLPSADMAVRPRGLDNLFNHYFSAADAGTLFDN